MAAITGDRVSPKLFIAIIAFVSVLILMALYLWEAFSRWAVEKQLQDNRARRFAVDDEDEPAQRPEGEGMESAAGG